MTDAVTIKVFANDDDALVMWSVPTAVRDGPSLAEAYAVHITYDHCRFRGVQQRDQDGLAREADWKAPKLARDRTELKVCGVLPADSAGS